MVDKKVLVGMLENCLKDGSCETCKYNEHKACKHFLIADALAWVKEQPEIIRCVNCKCHYNELMCSCGGYTPDDWFCANGVKKNEQLP